MVRAGSKFCKNILAGNAMIKNLCAVVTLCIWGTTLFAQKETDLPPIPSRPIVGYVFLVQTPLVCRCLKTNPLPPKQESVFSLDVSFSPTWDTVKEERIKNNTVQFGGTATSLRDTVAFNGWLVPRVNFADSDFRTTLEGGIMKTLNANPSRTMKQVRGTLEGSIWHVSVGMDGFFGQEEVPLAIKGVSFDEDFIRRSFGGQGWLGVKFGDFNRSFVVGRYGRGYARTEGSTRFAVSSIDNLDWLPVYLEEFKTVSFSVEGKIKTKRISQSTRFDKVEYERMAKSPDPLRFGENHLHDMWLRTETEIIPFYRVHFLRGVIVFTKDFQDQNRLMFFNDYSSVRVFLRLSFD